MRFRTPTASLPILILGVGVAIRAVQLLTPASFWIDEARLALNIGSRGLGGLLGPLDYEQVASPAFLWMERAAFLIGGMSEIALRIVPFVAGVSLLWLIWLLALHYLERRFALLVLAIASVSPVLIRHASEVKPYSIDAAVSAAVLLAACVVLRSPSRREPWFLFILSGTIAVLASVPSIQVLFPTLAVLVWSSGLRAHRRTARAAVCAMLWGAIFALQYFTAYRSVSLSSYMHDFWAAGFLGTDVPSSLRNAWHMGLELFWGTFFGGYLRGFGVTTTIAIQATVLVVFGSLSVLGLRRIARGVGGPGALLLVGPILAAVVAAALRSYPFSLRLVQYLVPAVLILIVSGMASLYDRIQISQRRLVLTALVLCTTGVGAVRAAVPELSTRSREETGELIEFYEMAANGEPIYVFASSLQAWILYTTDWSEPDGDRLTWSAGIGSYGGPAFENSYPRSRYLDDAGDSLKRWYGGRLEVIGLPTGMQWRAVSGLERRRPDAGWARNEVRRLRDTGAASVWLLFSHYWGAENELLEEIERDGAIQELAVRRPGAWLFRYRLPPLSRQD
jgi:hypothetical protein